MANLRRFFIIVCFFTSSIVLASGECSNERALARMNDNQIMSVARSTGIGKCKMAQISNGATTWIQVSGVFEFKGPVGKTFVQEEYPTGNKEAYDWAMQKVLIRFREKLIYCECSPN